MKKVMALILAAGFSRRMKKNKMILPLRGKAVIAHLAQAFFLSQTAGVSVVLGHEGERIRQALSGFPAVFIENPSYHLGMSSSVKAGILALLQDQALAGILLCPGDMPFIKTETINLILTRAERDPSGIIIPVYQGRKGHPVFFPRVLFSELLDITGDVGARAVVANHRDQCTYLEVADPGILIDIDSPEAYDKYR